MFQNVNDIFCISQYDLFVWSCWWMCCVQCQCYNGLVLSTESTVALYGTVKPVPEGKQVRQLYYFAIFKGVVLPSMKVLSWCLKFMVLFWKAPGGHELHCDFWELIGLAPAGGADNLLNEESDVDVQLNNRHMMIRGENVSKILKVRSTVTQCFRDHFFSRGYYEVIAWTMCSRIGSPGNENVL